MLRSRPKSKKVLYGIVILLVIGGALLYRNHQHSTTAKKAAQKNGYTSTTSKSHKSSSSTDNPGGSAGQGGAIDKQGQVTSSTPSSTWKTSPSGVITVKQPLSSSPVGSGSTLSGTAKIDKIQFRVIDNVSGVVAQGSLDVISDSFAGTLNFRSQSNSGRLDVFSYDSNGVEINEVQIPIGLK